MSDVQINRVIEGDCLEQLQELSENSIYAVITDPPYGLAFMGRDWDDFEPKEYQEWCEKWAREAKRVLKPGGHLLAFSGNRTHHRLFTGVEDAGFEIRDTLTWHYGSGFPKASDISKTIDKRADAEREVVGENPHYSENRDHDGFTESKTYVATGSESDRHENKSVVTAPATDAAKKWDGWKTGLKPATEYIVMARKPFDGATVDCVLEHGTGALNIDETRIGLEGKQDHWEEYEPSAKIGYGDSEGERGGGAYNDEGRYPSNVIFDEIAAEQLDKEVGELHESTESTRGSDVFNTLYEGGTDAGDAEGKSIAFGDSGGPSRYFYTSKASKSERTEKGKIENSHPTVKPIDLMEWIIKLVTKEGQIVLDPFCGSGTTLKACKTLNRKFIGIEQQSQWADVARVRVGLTPNDPSVVRGDDNQSGLEAYE